MKTGIYRNRLGVEIDVQRQVTGVGEYRVMGSIYEGRIKDELFGGDCYIVTAGGLKDAGYVLVKERTDA